MNIFTYTVLYLYIYVLLCKLCVFGGIDLSF